MSTASIQKGSTIVVTGVSGFVGSAIANGLLKSGFKVRGVVRSEKKADLLSRVFGLRYDSAFEPWIIPFQDKKDSMSEVVKGASGVIATASNVTFDKDPNHVIPSALDLVDEVSRAAYEEPTVKRLVFTSSSNACVRDRTQSALIDKDSWNSEAVRIAWEKPYSMSRVRDIYAASKVLAEQRLWEFAAKHQDLQINVVIPNFTMGAGIHEELQTSSNKYIRGMFDNDPTNIQMMKNFGSQNHTDVNDVALVHQAALVEADVVSQRILAVGEWWDFNTLLDIFREIDPNRTLPEPTDQTPSRARFDTRLALDLLDRYGQKGFTSLKESVRKCLDNNYI